MPKAIGTRLEWNLLADTDQMNKSVAIWHPNIYLTLEISQFNISLNAVVENGQKITQWDAFDKHCAGELVFILV